MYVFIIYPEYYIIFDWSCGYWLILSSSKNIIFYNVLSILLIYYFESLKICNFSQDLTKVFFKKGTFSNQCKEKWLYMQEKSRKFLWLGHQTILGANVLEKAIYFEVGRGGV